MKHDDLPRHRLWTNIRTVEKERVVSRTHRSRRSQPQSIPTSVHAHERERTKNERSTATRYRLEIRRVKYWVGRGTHRRIRAYRDPFRP